MPFLVRISMFLQLLFLMTLLQAQETITISKITLSDSANFRYIPLSFGEETKKKQLIDEIFENKEELVFTLFSATAITSILLLTDDKTYSSVHNIPKYTLLGKVNPILTEMGHGNFSLAIFGCLGIHHLFTKNEKSWEAAKLGVESFLASGLIVQILKNSFSRERPSHATTNGGKWHGPAAAFAAKNKGKSIANFDAFPSGHTATAFSTATILSYIYPDGAVPYISYFCAGIVAYTRVTESTHWFSDCFLGALIGYYSAKMIIALNHGNSNFNFNFGLQNYGAGINFQLKL